MLLQLHRVIIVSAASCLSLRISLVALVSCPTCQIQSPFPISTVGSDLIPGADFDRLVNRSGENWLNRRLFQRSTNHELDLDSGIWLSLSILIVNPIRCIVEQLVQLRELLVITV